jgi:hypothetical protein
LASELGKLETQFADAGFEGHANELGEALETIEGVLAGVSASGVEP